MELSTPLLKVTFTICRGSRRFNIISLMQNSPGHIRRTKTSTNDGNPDTFIDRIASVLTYLSEGVDNVTELAKRSHLSTSTVHRLLNMLAGPHFTVYDSFNHRYYLGPLISQLAANPSSNHQYLIHCAGEEMQRLSDMTEETIALNIMLGIQMINLHEIRSSHNLKVEQSEKGYTWQLPILPYGAVAKNLLSQLSDAELIFALKGITKLNANMRSEIDVESLTAQIQAIRKQGYAVTYGEMTPEALAISIPIKNYFCPAALSLLGPQSRLKSKVPQLVNEIAEAARRISDRIRI